MINELIDDFLKRKIKAKQKHSLRKTATPSALLCEKEILRFYNTPQNLFMDSTHKCGIYPCEESASSKNPDLQ